MIKCLLKFGFRFATIATFAILQITNLSIAKEEPYFDLPKKDPKEQCEEVEKPRNTCGRNINAQNWSDFHKCGNVYIKLAEVEYLEYGCGGGTTDIILDKNYKIVGMQSGFNNKEIIYGDSLNELKCIYFEERNRYAKQLKDSKIVLEVDNCFVKTIKY